ncbi:MAG: M1 family metallopeptidase [bacterium]|nr:M1 family metallopeptidase [bacterium]
MRAKSVAVLTLCLLMFCVSIQAQTEFFESFKDNYGQLGSELASKPPAELAEISDFVYEKDVATFTFKQGKMYLLRHLEGRPTTAIFLGEGHATIKVPSHTEQQALEHSSGACEVDQDFEMAFLNFSDDFDLRLKEKFKFEQTELSWRDFNKSQQGEFFFKPVVMHEYDNYFQLMRSLYERAEDGYFWIDFNRYCYSFDPNRPEEVSVAYEHEGGDTYVTPGASMQRQEKGVYDDLRMSDIEYPTSIIERNAVLAMAGLDGKVIDDGLAEIKLQINRDSLRFVSVWLHHNLKVDSIYLDGAPVDYWRRGDFAFTGVIMPSYKYKGDTISLTMWYHGKDYHPAFPFVSNAAPAPFTVTLDVPKGYNYMMPSMRQEESPLSGHVRYVSSPAEPYRLFQFQPCASGIDTIPVVSNIGITLNFLKSSHINKRTNNCFIPDEIYRDATIRAFDFMTGRFGPPQSVFAEYVYPEGGVAMPGLMGIPQVQCLTDGTGGLPMSAGNMAARQWFGPLMQVRTDREYWLMDALPDYLSLMHLWYDVSPGIFFGELLNRRDQLYTTIENDEDLPLAAGKRVAASDPVLPVVKGTWLMHMLRFLMYEPETQSDRAFLTFLIDLKAKVHASPITNADFIALCEKHYGQPLDWFFKSYFYSRNIPEFEVHYRIEQRDDGYYLPVTVETRKVAEDFKMPVIFRVQSEAGGSTYFRQTVEGTQQSFELGPLTEAPKELVFNEFAGVLSKDKVKKD